MCISPILFLSFLIFTLFLLKTISFKSIYLNQKRNVSTVLINTGLHTEEIISTAVLKSSPVSGGRTAKLQLSIDSLTNMLNRSRVIFSFFHPLCGLLGDERLLAVQQELTALHATKSNCLNNFPKPEPKQSKCYTPACLSVSHMRVQLHGDLHRANSVTEIEFCGQLHGGMDLPQVWNLNIEYYIHVFLFGSYQK